MATSITTLLASAIVHALAQILSLAISHWRKPNLFGDSFGLLQANPNQHTGEWLLSQHNEHRIVWAKIASLVETQILHLAPGQSAVFQILALLLTSGALWWMLCQRLVPKRTNCLLAVLCGWLLLLNPWQQENLSWEFQTPWFFINALVLCAALLLSMARINTITNSGRIGFLASILIPWLAVSSTGQGLAVAAAFSFCSLLHSKKLGLTVCGSSALAITTFYVFLPYSKPSHHPDIHFSIDYFLRAFLGGPWQGLCLAIAIFAAILIWRQRPMNSSLAPAILMPGLFSLAFTGMITLSRSGFGLEQANSSRYVTHSVMLALSLLLYFFATNKEYNQGTPLLASFLILLITVGSFPQRLFTNGVSYFETWEQAKALTDQKRKAFTCHAQRASLERLGIHLIEPCPFIYPDLQFINLYFQGKLVTQPQGWHQKLTKASINLSSQPNPDSPMVYRLEDIIFSPQSLKLKGWAYLKNNPKNRLFILAEYGAVHRLGMPIRIKRPDAQSAQRINAKNIGFEVAFPASYKNEALQQILIAGANHVQPVWSKKQHATTPTTKP